MRPKKQKAVLGDSVLKEACFNSQEPRAPPGSSKTLGQKEYEEGAGRQQLKKARRSIDYDEDDNSQADEMSASSSEDEYVKNSDDDDDEDDDCEDDDDVDDECAEDLAELAGAKKLLKGKISERESLSSQVLSLLSLLCLFSWIKVFNRDRGPARHRHNPHLPPSAR